MGEPSSTCSVPATSRPLLSSTLATRCTCPRLLDWKCRRQLMYETKAGRAERVVLISRVCRAFPFASFSALSYTLLPLYLSLPTLSSPFPSPSYATSGTDTTCRTKER